MAGIYIHIPYCKQACNYCDFHFSTNLTGKAQLVDCINLELVSQKNYLADETLNSIYFGGGTPSLLSHQELSSVLLTINKHFKLAEDIEVTIEANPENIEDKRLELYFKEGINRLSLGIQSFHDPWLKYLNRVHSSAQAIRSLECVSSSKIKNYSIDLIFGIQENGHKIWSQDLDTALTFNPSHISAYNLTIEEKTVFGNWLSKGKIQLVSDQHSAAAFEYAHNILTDAGYDHYEISNYSQEGCHSKHNKAYWKREKYLGVGPGAHSFNRSSRQFNVSNNAAYIQLIETGSLPYTIEQLTQIDMINEYIMTGLRTKWGCDMEALKSLFDFDLYKARADTIRKLLTNNLAGLKGNKLTLTLKGQLIADYISSELMTEPLKPDVV